MASAEIVSDYRHLTGCATCHDYLRQIVGQTAAAEARSAVLAFHNDCHRRDPRSLAADFFGTT